LTDLVATSGISLASLGIRDVGLLRSDALRAVEVLRHGKLPILGGDVYFRRGDRLEVAYANWYADPKPEEDRETYQHRSWDKAETYLKLDDIHPTAESQTPMLRRHHRVPR
jgi:hypothetical protein